MTPKTNDPYTARLNWNGRELRRHPTGWHAETRTPGVWQSAAWLGLVDVTAALDALHAEWASTGSDQAPPIEGQLELL